MLGVGKIARRDQALMVKQLWRYSDGEGFTLALGHYRDTKQQVECKQYRKMITIMPLVGHRTGLAGFYSTY